jgi:hypothetical protein
MKSPILREMDQDVNTVEQSGQLDYVSAFWGEVRVDSLAGLDPGIDS